jgi:hypothetical protein
MSRGSGFGLSLGILLVAVLIAAAITTWAAGSMAPTEAIYRPQHLLVY